MITGDPAFPKPGIALRDAPTLRESIREKVGEEESCPYLPEERSLMHYRRVEHCSLETYQAMLERGWRRFGSLFFRPGCRDCHECRSLRVEVERFTPDRSMRRTWRKNSDLQVFLQHPSVSREHLALYGRYHDRMAQMKDWPMKEAEPFDYYLTFVQGHGQFGYEMLYLLGDRLVAVALVDVLPRALSAVYCFYDPDLSSRSLGVYSVLRQLELARAQGRPHLYLGYWVAGNRSMRYKARYTPHEILAGRPEHREPPVWEAAPPAEDSPAEAAV